MRDLIGIPFVNKGRDRNGMDCWGLTMAVMLKFGKEVPEIDVSCFDTIAIHAIYEGVKARWTWRKVEIPEPGDLVIMSIDLQHPDSVHHVGVYIGNGRVIHTLEKRESHLIRVDDPYWSRKIVEFRRWEG